VPLIVIAEVAVVCVELVVVLAAGAVATVIAAAAGFAAAASAANTGASNRAPAFGVRRVDFFTTEFLKF
jgi:hypothetical protein